MTAPATTRIGVWCAARPKAGRPSPAKNRQQVAAGAGHSNGALISLANGSLPGVISTETAVEESTARGVSLCVFPGLVHKHVCQPKVAFFHPVSQRMTCCTRFLMQLSKI